MTMHLVGPYMTTTNYKRKKTKKTLSPNQQEKLRIQWKAHNKDCRKRHIHSAQFAELEDFIAYVNGTYKAPTKAHVATKPYQSPKVRDENIIQV